MKRPLAYITAAWFGGDSENAELAASIAGPYMRRALHRSAPPSICRCSSMTQYPRSIKAALILAVTCSAAPGCWWYAATA